MNILFFLTPKSMCAYLEDKSTLRQRRRKHARPDKTKVRPASPNTPQNRGQGQRLPGAVAVRLFFLYTKSGRRRPDRRKKDAGFEHNLPAGLQYYSGDRGR